MIEVSSLTLAALITYAVAVTIVAAWQAKWRVWNPDFGQEAEDGPTIYARDAESAAAEGAERMDMDGDYAIIRGTEAVLHVRPYEDDDDSRTTVFNIEAESVPQYRATEKRP